MGSKYNPPEQDQTEIYSESTNDGANTNDSDDMDYGDDR